MATQFELSRKLNQTYYEHPNENYPAISYAVLMKTLVYMIETLYGDEVSQTSLNDVWKNRMFLADVAQGTDTVEGHAVEQLRDIAATTKTTNINLPITAYNIGETVDFPDLFSFPALKGEYCQDSQRFIKAYPVELQILFLTIFNNAHDYQRAMSILRSQVMATLTRLYIPITVDGQIKTFTADLQMELTKGEYPFEFEAQRQKAELFDINHTVTLRFYDYQISGTVTPVEDVNMYLESYTGSNNPLDTVLVCQTPTMTVPSVSSVSPIDGATGVSVTDPLVITFSEGVRSDTLYYTLVPFIDTRYEFNATTTQLTITPKGGSWGSGTLYNFTIDKSLKNGLNSYMEDDFTMVFTTI